VVRGGASFAAFTMIEIAISLAVIGFALVAIIGILPLGMNVQKLNRQETIINQDASVLMNAIRNGERNVDDLTNYVLGITNYMTQFNARGVPVGNHVYGYTYTVSSNNGASMNPVFPITNGVRIVGLLSTPKLVPVRGGTFYSNHVVAFVRSLSGPASEKYPQNNPTAQELALSYRMVSDVITYSTNFFSPVWTNWGDQAIVGNTNEIARRRAYAGMVNNFQANFHEVRLNFRWPLLPNGNVPENSPHQAFRTTVSGYLSGTNEVGFPYAPGYLVYFFQPRIYAKQ
jgi:type II secretory pathway pseudopilin PulG